MVKKLTVDSLDAKARSLENELSLVMATRDALLAAEDWKRIALLRLALINKTAASISAAETMVREKSDVFDCAGPESYIKSSHVIFRLMALLEDIQSGL